MSLEEQFETTALRVAGVRIHNAGIVLQKDPSRSVFFTHFLASEQQNVSPFAGVQGSALIPDGVLEAAVDVPLKSCDHPLAYAHVLRTVVQDVPKTCPWSLQEYHHYITLHEEELSPMAHQVCVDALELSRSFKLMGVEAKLMDKQLKYSACMEFAERCYRLFLAARAFVRGDIRLAGALCGSFSPTVNVASWKALVVERAPCPNPSTSSSS